MNIKVSYKTKWYIACVQLFIAILQNGVWLHKA